MVGVEEEEDEAAGAPRGIDSPSSFVGDGGGGTHEEDDDDDYDCLLYTSPSPRDATLSRMPSSA